MNDSIERRLEKMNQAEIRKEKTDKISKIVLDVIAVLVLVAVIFWGFGGADWVFRKTPDKPVSEFFYSLTTGETDKLMGYVIGGDEYLKALEEREKRIAKGEKDVPEVIPSATVAEVLGKYSVLRTDFGSKVTVLYKKEAKENCTEDQLADINQQLKEYQLECDKACHISFSVRISGKETITKNEVLDGAAITVRIDGRWFLMPGSLEYSEVQQ